MANKLLIFNLFHGPNTKDLSVDSNSWYLKNYESTFDAVIHLSLMAKPIETISNGNSTYYLAGTGSTLINMLMAPIRLLQCTTKHKPSYILTYEQIWLWWVILPIRIFTKIPVYLLPLTYPEQMYGVTGKAISGILPIPVEKFLLKLSYKSSRQILTSFNLGNYINWMKNNPIIKRKLLIVDALPESVVFPAFMKRLKAIQASGKTPSTERKTIRLIYVGRLHKEKMTDHLIKIMALLKPKLKGITLTIVGQGNEKENLVNLAKEMNVHDSITFQDYVGHGELPDLLVSADIFVSPSTGHAFREAAICGLPIVAYNIDWIKGFLTHNVNFYGVEEIDYEKFADGIIEVSENQVLRRKLSVNIQEFAEKYWSSDNLQNSLKNVFSFS